MELEPGIRIQEIERSVETPQGRLYVREWLPKAPTNPPRPAFLLFHDSIGSVELWRHFPRQLALATGLRVIAYDRLGFGRSDPHPGKLSFTFIRDEGHEIAPLICESLGLEQIIALGHSVGGGMAITTAAALGSRCAGVIAESAQSYVEESTLEGVRAARVAFSRPGQLERLARYHGTKAAWALSAWLDTWLDPQYSRWSLDSELAQVHCPALVLHGDSDEYGTVEHPTRIIRNLGGPSRFILIENCGHIPHREHQERVLDEICAFVRSITPPPV